MKIVLEIVMSSMTWKFRNENQFWRKIEKNVEKEIVHKLVNKSEFLNIFKFILFKFTSIFDHKSPSKWFWKVPSFGKFKLTSGI